MENMPNPMKNIFPHFITLPHNKDLNKFYNLKSIILQTKESYVKNSIGNYSSLA